MKPKEQMSSKPHRMVPTPLQFVLLMVLTGLVSAAVFHLFGHTEQQSLKLLSIMHVVLIIGNAMFTAVVNANYRAEANAVSGKPIFRVLVYWLLPGFIGLLLITVTAVVGQTVFKLPAADTGYILRILMFWLCYSAIGQLAGRLNPGKPLQAVLAVLGMAVTLWLCLRGSMLVAGIPMLGNEPPDIVAVLTSYTPVSRRYDVIFPFYLLSLMIVILICLGFSYVSENRRLKAVVSPSAGLRVGSLYGLFLLIPTAMVMFWFHIEYPCGGNWCDSIRRMMPLPQIPLFFLCLYYGVFSRISREQWLKPGSAQRSLLHLLSWVTLHLLLWQIVLLPSRVMGGFCTRMDTILLLMPLSMALLTAALSMLYQALKLQWRVNPGLFLAIIVSLLWLPISGHKSIGSNLLLTIVTSTAKGGSDVWTYPTVLLLLSWASGGYLFIVSRRLQAVDNAEQNDGNTSIS